MSHTLHIVHKLTHFIMEAYFCLYKKLKQRDDKKLCMIEIKIFMVSQNDEIVKFMR